MPVFFEHSKGFLDSNSSLFDFLWTASAGLWNLRWQVDGLSRATNGYNDAHARSRFVAGSELGGVNLKRICIDESWDENKQRLARVALMLAISNFESWISDVVDYHMPRLADAGKDRAARMVAASNLQKPGEYSKTLNRLTGAHSSIMTKCIAPTLVAEHKAAINSLPNLVKVYRHFKDLRNKLSHEGGTADQQVVDSYTAAQSLSLSDLSMALPEMRPVSVGAPVSVSLHGVVGATGIIVRLVKAFDAILAVSQRAESVLIEMWRAKWGMQIGRYNMEAKRRQRKIGGRIRALGLATPHCLTEFDAFLQTKRLALE